MIIFLYYFTTIDVYLHIHIKYLHILSIFLTSTIVAIMHEILCEEIDNNNNEKKIYTNYTNVK